MAPKDPTDKLLHSPNHWNGWPNHGPTGITVHDEEGYHGPSLNWLMNPRSKASAHWLVRRDGYIVQIVNERDRAWHAGPGNNWYFGIEHEGGSGLGTVPILWKTPVNADRLRADDHMLIESARLVAYLCDKYDFEVQHDFRLPPRRDTKSVIAGHNQMAGNDHRDPGPQFPWQAYIAQVKEFLGDSGPSKPTNPETLYRVQLGAFSKVANAKGLAAELEHDGYDAYAVQRDGYWRTQTGAFSKRENAERLASRLQRDGYGTYITGKA